MIFAQYRDTVLEITELLQQHEPLVKVMSFIGQSSNGKSTKGFTQKEQLKVCFFLYVSTLANCASFLSVLFLTANKCRQTGFNSNKEC